MTLKQVALGSQPSLCILIPAFNESIRLPKTLRALYAAIETGAFDPLEVVQVLVVDDGSSDSTTHVARAAGVSVLSRPHLGKGAAIRAGIPHCKAEWILIADADFTVTWLDAGKLAQSCLSHGIPLGIASRGADHSAVFARKVAGWFFNSLARRVLGRDLPDTQCGFKLIRTDLAQAVFPGLRTDGFAWDVELLLRLKDTPVVSVPVRFTEPSGSKVRLVRDGLRMVWDVIRLWAQKR